MGHIDLQPVGPVWEDAAHEPRAFRRHLHARPARSCCGGRSTRSGPRPSTGSSRPWWSSTAAIRTSPSRSPTGSGRSGCLANDHTPGLPGGRNAGVAVARHRSWLSATTTTSGSRRRRPASSPCSPSGPTWTSWSAGSRSTMDGESMDRALEQREVTFTDLLESRLMEVNFCTAMVRRDAFLGPDRSGGRAHPRRATPRTTSGSCGRRRSTPIAVVPEPLVIVEWHAAVVLRVPVAGHRRRARLPRSAGIPEFKSAPQGLARILGQRSFALAALGQAQGGLERDPGHRRAELAGAPRVPGRGRGDRASCRRTGS